MNDLYVDPSVTGAEAFAKLLPFIGIGSLVILGLIMLCVHLVREDDEGSAMIALVTVLAVGAFSGSFFTWQSTIAETLEYETNSATIADELNENYAVNVSAGDVLKITGWDALIKNQFGSKVTLNNTKLGDGSLVVDNSVTDIQLWMANGELKLFGAEDGKKLEELPRR
jgi:hypothetical protein